MYEIEKTGFCLQHTAEQYAEIVAQETRTITPLGENEGREVTLLLDNSVRIQERHEFHIGAVYTSSVSGNSNFVLYVGPFPADGVVKVLLPHARKIWPDEYYLQFDFFLPDSRRICTWGGEEPLKLENAEYPRKFKIRLLPYPVETSDGGTSRITIEPLRD